MRLMGEEPETLDAILITHEHSDHVGGVAVTARKLGIPVYFTEGTHRAWMRWISPRKNLTYAQWLEQIRKQAAERQAEVPSDGSMSLGWSAGEVADQRRLGQGAAADAGDHRRGGKPFVLALAGVHVEIETAHQRALVVDFED